MRAANKIPTFDALVETLLAALNALGGSGSIEEIYAKTVEVSGISEAVESQMHDPDKSNMTEVGYRLARARTYLRKYDCWKTPAEGSG
jgi:restriction system protein